MVMKVDTLVDVVGPMKDIIVVRSVEVHKKDAVMVYIKDMGRVYIVWVSMKDTVEA